MALPRVGAIFAPREAHRRRSRRGRPAQGETDEAIAAYEKALADARARAQAIAGETRDKLAAEADERRKTLEGELNAKLAEAEKTIAATKTRP